MTVEKFSTDLSTFGARLESELIRVFGGVSKAGKQLRGSPSMFYGYTKRGSRLGKELEEELSKAGVDMKYVIFGEAESTKFVNENKHNYTIIPTKDPVSEIKIPLLLSPAKAGQPSWAGDDISMYVDIHKRYHEGTYYVVVQGNSMTAADIKEGDRLLIDESLQPIDGNVVLARADGGLIVKRLKRNGSQTLLCYEGQSKHEPILVDGDRVKVIGVVILIERTVR